MLLHPTCSDVFVRVTVVPPGVAISLTFGLIGNNCISLSDQSFNHFVSQMSPRNICISYHHTILYTSEDNAMLCLIYFSVGNSIHIQSVMFGSDLCHCFILVFVYVYLLGAKIGLTISHVNFLLKCCKFYQCQLYGLHIGHLWVMSRQYGSCESS